MSILKNYKFIDIDIVGLGGTGGILLDLLGIELLKDIYKDCRLNLIDGDTISNTNFKRQRFLSSQSVDKLYPSFGEDNNESRRVISIFQAKTYKVYNKLLLSKVLGYKVNEVYSLFISKDNYKNILENRNKDNSLVVIFGCVDNNEARISISKALAETQSLDYIYLTSGNDSCKGSLYSKMRIKGVNYPDENRSILDAVCSVDDSESLQNNNNQSLSINNFMAGLLFSSFIRVTNFGIIDYLTKFDDGVNNKGGNTKDNLGIRYSSNIRYIIEE